MGLYKILLVDDEEEIRLGMKKTIDWQAYGFEVVGDAENGREAFELAEKLMPDLVVSDIRMPFVDGLQLTKMLKEEYPTIKVLLFSGFDDFTYAHQAIQYNVIDYVLKPINAAEFETLLQKIKATLDMEYQQRRDIEKLRAHYLESIPIMREKLLVSLLEGKIHADRIVQQAQNVGLSLTSPYYAVGCVYLDSGSFDDHTTPADLLPLSVLNELNQTMPKYCRCAALTYNDCVAVIASLEQPEEICLLLDGLNEADQRIQKYLNARVTIGVGRPYDSLERLNLSYKEALNALDYRLIFSPENIFYIDDMEPQSSSLIQFDDADEQALQSVIRLGNPDKIYELVSEILARLPTVKTNFNNYQMFLIELMTVLLKIVRTYKLDPVKIFGSDLDYYSYMLKFEQLQELKDWFSHCCVLAGELIRCERTDAYNQLAANAKEFISRHYADSELSVDMLCNHLHVSPGYFSTIFKRETGMSFVNYLTQVRLNAAVDLLNTTDSKSYIIAKMVGFSEPNYFSYVFKKHFGVSPSKYKRNGVGEE